MDKQLEDWMCYVLTHSNMVAGVFISEEVAMQARNAYINNFLGGTYSTTDQIHVWKCQIMECYPWHKMSERLT